MRLPITAVFATCLLSACATPVAPPASPAPVAGQCRADAARWAIGRAPSAEVVEKARLDTGSSTVRVVRPGEMVTMDYRADRLNIRVNAREAIDGLSCG